MIKEILSIFLAFSAISCFGEDYDPATTAIGVHNFSDYELYQETNDDNKVYTAVDEPPTFPGGVSSLLKFIADSIRYPTEAQENGIQGRVIVMFVVTKTGKVGEVMVVSGMDPNLDKEAIRVVKSLPDFIPGKMNGNAVNVLFTIPINFRLQSIESQNPT